MNLCVSLLFIYIKEESHYINTEKLGQRRRFKCSCKVPIILLVCPRKYSTTNNTIQYNDMVVWLWGCSAGLGLTEATSGIAFNIIISVLFYMSEYLERKSAHGIPTNEAVLTSKVKQQVSIQQSSITTTTTHLNLFI